MTTTNTQTNATETTPAQDEATVRAIQSAEDFAHKTLGAAVELGRVWANYGLGLGRAALDASIQSLDLARSTLAEVQNRVEKPAADADA